MKKISSKIIISVLLALLLWSGVGFGTGLKIKQALAITCEAEMRLVNNPPAGATAEQIAANRKAFTDCNAAADEKFLAEQAAQKNSNWFDWLVSGIVKGGGILAKGAGSVALNVIATIETILVIPLLGALVRITAAMLGIATKYTLQSGNITVLNEAITATWSLVRNIFNITFIFILLWSAIQLIVGIAGANTKKIIANVIISALLINFSLFFTRILVDAGNILANSLYEKVIQGEGSMGGVIMGWTQVSSLFKAVAGASIFSPETFIIVNLQIAILWITLGIFLYMTYIFLVRNVMLIFLMVLSPLGFMGNILPKIEEYSKMWWENLFGQIAIAPFFFLFFFLIYKIQSTLSIPIGDENFKDFENGDIVYMTYFRYVMVIILLITAGKMAKKLSGEVGKVAQKIGAAALSLAAIAATGGTAVAMGAGKLGFTKAVGGLVTGDLGKKRGATGLLARYSRDKFMGTVKDVSYGKADLKKIEKDWKQSQKENEERIMKEMEAVGPQKAMDNHKRFSDIQGNIDEQLKRENEDLHTKGTKAKNDILTLENDVKAAERKADEAKNDTDRQKALEEKKTAQSVLDLAREENKKILADFKSAQDTIAASMGTSIDDITKGLADSVKGIREGMAAKNTYIKDFEKGGVLSTGMFKKGRKDLANKMRAQQGKFKGEKDIREALKKIVEDQGIVEGKKEEKPKAGEGKTT